MAFICVRGLSLPWIETTRRIHFLLGCLCVCILLSIQHIYLSAFMKCAPVNQAVISENRMHMNLTHECISEHTEPDRNNTAILKDKMKSEKQQKQVIPIRKTTDKYTLGELKQRAKTDQQFLARIMGQDYLLSETKLVLQRYLLDKTYHFTYNTALEAGLKDNFNIDSDVIVFLHIQKTGGMHFNDRINRELQKHFTCRCRRIKLPSGPCNCLNPKDNMWFYNTAYCAWQCGLHADWTQMHKCIPGLVEKIEKKRRLIRYFYFTQLRDGVERYMSEYHHQTATNHWQSAILGCGATLNANKHEVIPCFNGRNWKGVTLDAFMACVDNLASHRMTRMLADLTLSGCYANFTDRNTLKARAPIWLQSSKNNLQTMEYIGLMEDEAASDKLFHKTYNLTFKKVLKHSESTSSGATMRMTEEQFLKVLTLSELDIHLYLFGKDLFYKRLKEITTK